MPHLFIFWLQKQRLGSLPLPDAELQLASLSGTFPNGAKDQEPRLGDATAPGKMIRNTVAQKGWETWGRQTNTPLRVGRTGKIEV